MDSIDNFTNHTFNFYAYTDIKVGKEILINYNDDVDDKEPLWFNKGEMDNSKNEPVVNKGDDPMNKDGPFKNF